jgi:hypothetical protein
MIQIVRHLLLASVHVSTLRLWESRVNHGHPLAPVPAIKYSCTARKLELNNPNVRKNSGCISWWFTAPLVPVFNPVLVYAATSRPRKTRVPSRYIIRIVRAPARCHESNLLRFFAGKYPGTNTAVEFYRVFPESAREVSSDETAVLFIESKSHNGYCCTPGTTSVGGAKVK